MRPTASASSSNEIELKLALSTGDPAGLAKRLRRIPMLAQCQSVSEDLRNVYYDTPEQLLRQARVALRIRRVERGRQVLWLQTLKTGGSENSALSQRGEWEVSVDRDALSLKALADTPWSQMDPDGQVFAALEPCFVTSFQRVCWLVRWRDGSEVEVALDLGQLVCGGATAPICELELELKLGVPLALFEVAQQIARTVTVLPLSTSKAARGYALAQNCLDRPQRAQPPLLTHDMPLSVAARCVLREMFNHFTANLETLRTVDRAEVVHQARVGWRRFKSALHLFKPVLIHDPVPTRQALRPLLRALGELRDLEVAQTETLAPLEDAYTGGDPQRERVWQDVAQALAAAVVMRRDAVRHALETPAIGASLLAITHWLETDAREMASGDEGSAPNESLRHWARHRMARAHARLKAACTAIDNPISQHRARILAKRLRYGIEALQPLLPKQRSKRWYQRATGLQISIGTVRDTRLASELVARLGGDPGLVEFLRGVAVGRSPPVETKSPARGPG